LSDCDGPTRVTHPPRRGVDGLSRCLRRQFYDHYAWRYYLQTEKDKAWHFLAGDDSWQNSYFSANNQVKSAELNFWLGADPMGNALPTPHDSGSTRVRPALQQQTGGISPAIGPHAIKSGKQGETTKRAKSAKTGEKRQTSEVNQTGQDCQTCEEGPLTITPKCSQGMFCSRGAKVLIL
jgi:hypothetical protein